MLNIYNQNNHTDAEPTINNGKKITGKKPNYLSYVDALNEFNNKQLKRGLWLVHNKVLLYRLLVGGLIGAVIILWGFSLWRWGDYIIFGITNDQSLYNSLRNFPNYTNFHPHFAPEPLTILGTQLFQSGVDKYDAVAEVANPNERFFVEFDYIFVINGGAGKRHHAFLLPGETRPLAEFGTDQGSSSGNIVVTLENVRWRRISNKTVVNTKNWQEERLNFEIKNFVFNPPNPAAGVGAYSIQFNLINRSPYGYVEPELYVGLLSGGELVGVIPLRLRQLPALSEYAVDLRSFALNLNVSEIKIFPLINLYNNRVYLPPPT